MRAVVQRTKGASVKIEGEEISSIKYGIVVFLGVEKNDDDAAAAYLADKIVNLRIFEDNQDKMNLSLIDVQGEVLSVSQFTLLADCRKGRRPGFSEAAPPEEAENLYKKFNIFLRDKSVVVKEGVFQANMQIELINDGPVTILLDSKKTF